MGFNIIEGFHSWATNALIILCSVGCRFILAGSIQYHPASYNLPQITRNIMTAAMLGIVSSVV